MSYCRFAWDNSDVYVYESESGLECAGCKLTSDFGGFTANEGDLGDVDRTLNPASFMKMIVHLRMHRAMGHVVPMYAPASLSEEAGLWTPERVLWAIIWRWKAAHRPICRRFGHKPIPSLISSPEYAARFKNPHRKCARCGMGSGYAEDDGTVRWLYEEVEAERKKKGAA